MVSAVRCRARAAARALVLLAGGALLAGCGPDVAGAAAAGAATEAAQLKQAQDEKARILERVKEADKAQQERLKEMDRDLDRNAQ